MRRATQQALSIPTFGVPDDCTPWVLGGLWPPELDSPAPERASLADHLKRDLHQIATSANRKLVAINESRIAEPHRQTEQIRVINVARALAVLRVETTIRQLRGQPLAFQSEYLRPAPGPDDQRSAGAMAAVDPDQTTAVLEAVTKRARPRPVVDPGTKAPVPPAEPPAVESDPAMRLQRLVEFVARQEPALRWAVGEREGGRVVLVTDLAYGWIPPGIDIPTEVEVLTPQHRNSTLADLLGPVDQIASYRPGDSFSPVTFGPTRFAEVRCVETIDDLDWRLTEATANRDGLPQIARTAARAVASGRALPEAEYHLLLAHLDTVRYQLVTRYGNADTAALANCMLLAATAASVTRHRAAANYHFAWFLELAPRV